MMTLLFGKISVLCFVLLIVSIVWIKITSMFLTPNQIMNRDYPLWIMLPTYVIEATAVVGTVSALIWLIGVLFFK